MLPNPVPLTMMEDRVKRTSRAAMLQDTLLGLGMCAGPVPARFVRVKVPGVLDPAVIRALIFAPMGKELLHTDAAKAIATVMWAQCYRSQTLMLILDVGSLIGLYFMTQLI